MSSLLTGNATAEQRATLSDVLARYPVGFEEYLVRNGVTLRFLAPGESYNEISPELHRLGLNVDAWPAPPAGLFVIAERAVYVQKFSPMTFAHELAHAFDCALGGGAYVSGANEGVRKAFSTAPSFVTPYAASGIDEYFAECVRAYIGVNDPAPPWPAATRERLAKLDPNMLAFIRNAFARACGQTA